MIEQFVGSDAPAVILRERQQQIQDGRRNPMENVDPRLVARHICSALPRYAYRFSNEMQLHDRISAVLKRESVAFAREQTIGNDRFDFLCEAGVVIEAKIGGSFAEAVRQVERYCHHEQIRSVIIVSTRSWRGGQTGETIELHQKPVHFIRLRAQSF